MLLVLLPALLLLSASPQLPRDAPRDAPPPASGTAVIRGQVTDKESGLPLTRFLVRLMPATGKDSIDAWTDRGGRFQFTSLSAGKYYLVVEPPQFRATHLQQMYGVGGPSDSARPFRRAAIDLRDGEVRDNVIIPLWRALAISGRVLDELGEPMANVDVVVQRIAARDSGGGGPVRMTDDRGAFRVFGLVPGEYRVCARPPNFGSFSSADSAVRPVRTCYPSAVADEDAQPVTVSNTDVEGIEIRVQRSRAFTVSGVVLDASGSPAGNFNVGITRTERNNSFGASVEVKEGGRFVARAITPGEYTLRAESTPSIPGDTREREMGTLPIRVESSDLENLVVMMNKPAKVAGHVVFEEGTPANAVPKMTIVVRSDPTRFAGTGIVPNAPVKADLTFELTGLFGPYIVGVTGAPSAWMTRAIRYKGADITDIPTEFKSSGDPSELEIVLSNRGAILSGRVLDDRDAVVHGARVYLFPADPRRWSLGYSILAAGATREDGTFRFPPRRPGEYFVVAVDPEEPYLPMETAGTYELLAKVADKVTLLDADRRTTDLRAVTLPK